jgi:regulatory protein
VDTLPDPAEAIDRFLERKLRGRTPDEKEKKRLSDALLRRGFSWSDVRAGLNRLGAELWED